MAFFGVKIKKYGKKKVFIINIWYRKNELEFLEIPQIFNTLK